jgi:hypothetical protein
MLDQLITSETRIRLLLKFFINPNTRSYLRKLASEFNESTNGIRVELNKLSEAKILASDYIGRNRIYRANIRHPLFEDIRNIVLKSTGIDKVVYNIIQKIGPVERAFIRGDYAVGKDSGLIDLVIIADKVNTAEIERVRKKTEKLINRKIAVLVLSSKEYNQLKNNFDQEKVLELL